MTEPENEPKLHGEPAEIPPLPEPSAAQAVAEVPGPVYVKDPPAWSYFLTPLALVLGSLIIAGTIWWTRDDNSTPTTPANPEVSEAVGGVSSVVPPTQAAASSATGLLETMKTYARQTGLNEDQFTQCISSPENVTELNTSLKNGSALGVTGTPTFFINNKKLVGAQPIALLQEIIDAELKGSPTTLDGYSPALKSLAANNPPGFAILDSKPDISGAPIEGNPNAKVIVAEYSDFQCPFCKQWTDSSLRQLRAELGDDVALAFLHFPIVQIHPNAGNAALVAICAGKQGKFWEMHDLLFSRQSEWASLN
ncbi:MAG: DsbA family protein [Dehalococcoidia bacterium]